MKSPRSMLVRDIADYTTDIQCGGVALSQILKRAAAKVSSPLREELWSAALAAEVMADKALAIADEVGRAA